MLPFTLLVVLLGVSTTLLNCVNSYCIRGELIGKNVKDNNSSIKENNIYKSNRKKLVLVLLSDSYSKLEIILINVNRSSSYSVLYFLLTTSTTDYYFKENINKFNLRRSFYSRKYFKSNYYYLV